jgi:hypothetical protein
MKHTNLLKTLTIGLLFTAFISCEDNVDPLIKEVKLDRVLTPINVVARIRNVIVIELTWDLRDEADYYVVEFSEDSLEFNVIDRTVIVQPDELPLQEEFFGGTRYSARVKGVSEDDEGDSHWAAVTIMTENENIFEPIENADVTESSVTLNWPATATNVTHIIVNPGGTQYDLSAGEKSAGQATITGLTGYTHYTFTLFAGAKQRGESNALTLFDPAGTMAVGPGDDLSAVIAAASSGAILLLAPGEYLAYTGSIAIDKPLKIVGQFYYNKPLINVYFSLSAGATDVSFIDLEIVGTPDFTTVVNMTSVGTFNSVTIMFERATPLNSWPPSSTATAITPYSS